MIRIFLNTIFLCVHLGVGYFYSIHELFIKKYSIVSLNYFYINIPTLMPIFALLGIGLALYGVVKIYVLPHDKIYRYWIYQLVGFLIYGMAWLIHVVDFFNHAFEGIG